MYLVRSGAIAGMPQLVRELGANPIEIIEQAGLSEAQFRAPDTYVPYDKLADILELCARHCDSPLFGLMLAERQTPMVLGGLAVAATIGTSVGEVLTITMNHLYLHASGVHLQKVQRDRHVEFAISFDFMNSLGNEQLTQLSVGHLAMFSADLLNDDCFGAPLYFRQHAPESFIESTSRFHPLKFNQAFDGICLTEKQLSRSRNRNEQILNAHLHEFLKQLKGRHSNRLEDQIGEIISHLLPTGEISIERVAKTLGIHPRTMQQQLKQTGTSYRKILQKTRLNCAKQNLQFGETSITDLALQLGYADIAVFSRHFKRWTGMSPRSWQKQNKNPT